MVNVNETSCVLVFQKKPLDFMSILCLFFSRVIQLCFIFGQSFSSLPQKPLSVDLTVENGQRLKVIYGSHSGFHAVDVDSGTPFDLYLPSHVSIPASTCTCSSATVCCN